MSWRRTSRHAKRCHRRFCWIFTRPVAPTKESLTPFGSWKGDSGCTDSRRPRPSTALLQAVCKTAGVRRYSLLQTMTVAIMVVIRASAVHWSGLQETVRPRFAGGLLGVQYSDRCNAIAVTPNFRTAAIGVVFYLHTTRYHWMANRGGNTSPLPPRRFVHIFLNSH